MHEPKEAYYHLPKEFWLISRVVQGKAWCIRSMDMYTYLDTLIQDMLVTEEIESLLLGIILLLEKI